MQKSTKQIFFSLYNGAEHLVDTWTWNRPSQALVFSHVTWGKIGAWGHRSLYMWKCFGVSVVEQKRSRAESQEPEGLHSHPSPATYWPGDHRSLSYLLCASVSFSVRWESNSTWFTGSLWGLNALTFGKGLEGAWNIARFSYHGCELQAASEMKGIIILTSEIGVYPYTYLPENELFFF